MIEATRSDSITINFIYDGDITNWKIRANIEDHSGHSLKLATANVTGGSNNQIEITDGENGNFNLYVAKDLTTNFDCEAELEIEVETTETVGGETEKLTIKKLNIKFLEEKLDWTDVS